MEVRLNDIDRKGRMVEGVEGSSRMMEGGEELELNDKRQRKAS